MKCAKGFHLPKRENVIMDKGVVFTENLTISKGQIKKVTHNGVSQTNPTTRNTGKKSGVFKSLVKKIREYEKIHA